MHEIDLQQWRSIKQGTSLPTFLHIRFHFLVFEYGKEDQKLCNLIESDLLGNSNRSDFTLIYYEIVHLVTSILI